MTSEPATKPARRGSFTEGSLDCVGLGIRAVAETTPEVRALIQQADRVFSVVSDSFSLAWLRQQNPEIEPLNELYAVWKDRRQTYAEMVERILAAVCAGQRVCAVAYGHPGVFVDPFHEAVDRARKLGLRARMLPAVSAQDCLIADLGIDPGVHGCQSFDATDFVVHRRVFDARSQLLLWQIGIVGNLKYYQDNLRTARGLAVLTDVLLERYPASHGVVLYEAATHPIFDSRTDQLRLCDLRGARVTAMTTLYVPPGGPSVPDPEMLARLRLTTKAPKAAMG